MSKQLAQSMGSLEDRTPVPGLIGLSPQMDVMVGGIIRTYASLEALTEKEQVALGIYQLEPAPETPLGLKVEQMTPLLVNGVAQWIVTYSGTETPVRRAIPKSVIQERVNAIGKLDEVLAVLNSQPIFFARWFAPDWPNVYADDEGLLAILAGVGCTPAEIETITAP